MSLSNLFHGEYDLREGDFRFVQYGTVKFIVQRIPARDRREALSAGFLVFLISLGRARGGENSNFLALFSSWLLMRRVCRKRRILQKRIEPSYEQMVSGGSNYRTFECINITTTFCGYASDVPIFSVLLWWSPKFAGEGDGWSGAFAFCFCNNRRPLALNIVDANIKNKNFFLSLKRFCPCHLAAELGADHLVLSSTITF